MHYLFPLLAQVVPDPGKATDLLSQILENPEKITFAVFALVLLIALILMIVLLFKTVAQDRLNPKLLTMTENANKQTVEESKRQDLLTQVLENLVKDQQDFRLQVATMPEQIIRPLSTQICELGRLQDIVRRNPIRVGVVACSESGRIVAINEDALAMFGWSAETVLGRFIFNYDLNIIDHDQQRVLPAYYPSSIALLRKERVANRLMGVYNASLKEWVWVVVTAEPTVEPDGRATRVLSSFIEAGRVTSFNPDAEYARSLSDTAEVTAIRLRENAS